MQTGSDFMNHGVQLVFFQFSATAVTAVHRERRENNGSEDVAKCVSCVICHSEGQDM